MYKRKLMALDYPTPDKFNIEADNEFKSIVLWLEDQKIRHYKVDDRGNLRNFDSPNWNAGYKKYLNDLACPITSGQRSEELEWLLGFAIRLEFYDNVEKYKTKIETSTSVPKVVSANVLDKLDFQSPAFIQGVKSLASILKISQHPNHLVTLKAVSKIVASRLSPEALQNPSSVIVEGTPFPFEEIDHSEISDVVLRKAAKVLRLLYIINLRELQTQINECIVSVQTMTANPKTDTKIGQVGR